MTFVDAAGRGWTEKTGEDQLMLVEEMPPGLVWPPRIVGVTFAGNVIALDLIPVEVVEEAITRWRQRGRK